MRPVENIKQSIKKLNITPTPELHDRVLGDLLNVMEESKKNPSAETMPNTWRLIMKNKIIKVGTHSQKLNFFQKRLKINLRDCG
jgi:hypothetical protein